MIGVDSKVTARVIAALLEDPHVSTSLMEVSYERGTVTLSGTVPSEEARRAAEEIVHRLEGVLNVTNNLCVAPRRQNRRWLDDPDPRFHTSPA